MRAGAIPHAVTGCRRAPGFAVQAYQRVHRAQGSGRPLDAERFCCDGRCADGAPCPQFTDPAYRESAADFADERYPQIRSVEEAHPWLWQLYFWAAVDTVIWCYAVRALRSLVS